MLHELVVAPDQAGIRLDVFLEQHLEGCSRSLVGRCIKRDRCTITPGKAKPGYRLRGGEAVAIEVPAIEPLQAVPEDIPLAVLYEDEKLLVVDKPAGMVVHPAIGHPRGTLLNAVLGHCADTGGQPGLIHRLDADTSGVIAVAKTAAAQAFCQDAFRDRRVIKRYLVLVHGHPRADYFEHHGWIGRHSRDFRKRAVVADGTPGGRAAETHFLVRLREPSYSVLEARLLTGRTHQIRVHLADRGHPCLADGIYGRSVSWPLGGIGPAVLRRQALHAWYLELPHPDGFTLRVQAPLPEDLRPWVDPSIVAPV
jgi:23S rRNA pseudouridine1911/1915/1917 synthase